MAIIGIIGNAEADAEVVKDGLTDLLEKSNNDGDDTFWAIVGITEDSPEVISTVIEWLQENEVAYDLVITPTAADGLAEVAPEILDGADATVKIKGVDSKVVSRLKAEGGTHLLVLLGEEPEDALVKIVETAVTAGIKAQDLSDALTELEFTEDEDATEPESEPAPAKAKGATKKGAAPKAKEEPKVDYEQLGLDADCDEDDDDYDAEAAQVAMEELTTVAKARGVDPDDYATWSELATFLAVAAGVDEVDAGETTEYNPDDEPVGWTEEALAGKNLTQLKQIAKASGVADASKMTRPNLVKALLALSGAPEEAEGNGDAEAEVAKPTKGARTKSPGKPLNGVADTGNVEINEALGQVVSGLTRLVNALAS